MDISALQILYALIFLSIIMVVEGGYILWRANTTRGEQVANRRMKAMANRDAVSVAPSVLREQVLGGSMSQAILSVMPFLKDAFWAANVPVSPARASVYCAFAFVVLAVLMGMLLPLPAPLSILIAGVVAFGLPVVILQGIVSHQRKKFQQQLPDAINLITRGLQAGHPVSVAFGMVAREMPDPIGSEFGNAIDEINFGRDRSEALRDIAERFPVPEFMFFCAAVEMQKETGGNLVGILDNLTKVIRERTTLQRKAFAISAEGRLTAMIVGALPYVLGAMLLLTNPNLILGAVDDPLFWPLMTGAWVLWLIGIIMIWRMVNIKV